AWVNTATLRHFGISGHDEDGVITEREWFDLARRANDTDNATLDEWAMDAAKHAASRGVVGIVDLELRYNAPDWIRRSEAAGGRYPLRVEAGVYPDDLDRAIAEGLRSGQQLAPGISVGPFKIITDGSLNTRTAHCVEPYLTVSPPEFGAMNFPPADIAAILTKAQEAGFWLAVHAIGDEANRIILDIFEEHGLRGRIEHAQLVREEDFPRFSELGIAASVQPEHAVDDRDVTDVYWADRSARAFALRRLVDSGATLALGSDAPVSPLDPWVSIAAAVTRTRDGRDPWHHEQALTVEEALRFSYRSTLEVSQPADIAVLDADPAWLMGAFGNDMAKASDALRAMPVALTVCAGVVTHREL
ncbi:MAG: amidohydrolase family protein, partial [Pontimonas sp.]|nr:amidohydrolase family protein [Pontimonas sp.]